MAQLLINEIDVDQIGVDALEFVEILNAGDEAYNLSIDHHVLVFFNGNDDTLPAIDGSYRAVDLSGLLPAGERLVLGSANVPNVDIIIAGGGSNLIQNGTDAVALYEGAAGDWTESRPPTTGRLVDAIVYGTGDDDDEALRDALDVDQHFDEWDGLENVGAVFSIARTPDGGFFSTGATPTPGLPNDAAPPVFAVADATLTLIDNADPVPVTLRGDGGVGALRFRVRSIPENGTLFDGPATITADELPHEIAHQLQYLHQPGFDRIDSFTFDVIDGLNRISDPAVQEIVVQSGGIVISEVMHSPGTGNAPQDQRVYEYVEIFNYADNDISLTRLDNNVLPLVDTTDNLVLNGQPAVIPAWEMRIIAPGGLTAESDDEFLCEWGLAEEDILRIPHEKYENLFQGSRLVLFGADGQVLDAVNLGPEDFWTPIPGASQSVKESYLILFGYDFDAQGNDPILVWPYAGLENVLGLRQSYSGIGQGSPGYVPADYNEDFLPLPECVPPPLGACCLPDGICHATSNEVCIDRAGQYAGDFITCQQSEPCEQPRLGACCKVTGDCETTDAYTCQLAGGKYEGDGSDCAGLTCQSTVNVVINELEYDQAGQDTAEYIEILAPAGLSLFGYTIALYNAESGTGYVYNQVPVLGITPDDGHFVIGTANVANVDQTAFTVDGIQNGDPDGIALIAPLGEVLETLAYGGTFIAVDGPAAGEAFEDIGVTDTPPDDDDPTDEITLQRIPDGVGAWTVTTDGGIGLDGTPGTFNVVPLPSPYGACCLPGGECLGAIEPLLCDSIGGNYQGDAAACDTDCPILIGACCLPNGECEPRTFVECQSSGGLFFGEATHCAQIEPCPAPPNGACCLNGGGCVEDDPYDCALFDGDYRGHGTECDDQNCGLTASLLINEIYRNDPSLDDMEFIELFGPGGTSLAGYAVLEIEGDQSPSGQEGTLDSVWLLDAFTMPGDGHFVIGDDAVENVDFPIGPDNNLENGSATVVLVRNFNAFDFPQGTDIDVDNDGLLDEGLDLGLIIDAVAIVDSGIDVEPPETDRTYFDAVTLGPFGNNAPAGVARRLDGMNGGSSLDFCILGLAGDGSDDMPHATPGQANTCALCLDPGELTGDPQIDLIDFARFQACHTGMQGPINPPRYEPDCACADIDGDGDIDRVDFAAFTHRVNFP